MLSQIILTLHLIASIVWTGSVFMGTFIDWPSARKSVEEGKFPFQFIVGQGSRVFYSVYFGITLLWVTGIVLVLLNPPASMQNIAMLGLKILALIIMTGLTLHGTFDTWPKLQFSTDAEAFDHYEFYMNKARVTFICGIIASVIGLWMYY